MTIKLKSSKDLEKLRISGKILGEMLVYLKKMTGVGVNLKDLDAAAKKFLEKAGAKSAFSGYVAPGSGRLYPAQICTSLNNQIVHGIPRDYKLKNGDVLKIDAGVNYEGYITDAALTVALGEVSEKIKSLIKTTEEALIRAIQICRPGNQLGDIGSIIQKTLEKKGFAVYKGLTGHGVGFALHEDPDVLNYGERGTGLELKAGMVLAIEPMAGLGADQIKLDKNESFVTADGSIAAHFEKTVAILEHGCDVLTPY